MKNLLHIKCEYATIISLLIFRAIEIDYDICEVKIMKTDIQPEYYQATVTCNCGNTFVTGSTKKELHVEICSKCHPFYTGQQKASQARGRIEQFNKKYGMK